MSVEIDAELNQWLEMLHAPNADDRLVAIKMLQHLGDEAALDGVIAALQDENVAVQKLAVTTVWEFANPKAVPALVECLTSPNQEIREEAHSALGELVSQDHLLLLLDALHRDNDDLQLNLLILLRKIHDAQALPSVLPFFQSANPTLREAAVTTLRYP
jgi:HEAT repeat protein